MPGSMGAGWYPVWERLSGAAGVRRMESGAKEKGAGAWQHLKCCDVEAQPHSPLGGQGLGDSVNILPQGGGRIGVCWLWGVGVSRADACPDEVNRSAI